MTNRKHSKKRWFTLIEMLIVIVIIWILAAYLIPRISSAQGKARDVARQADVNQITSALVAYSLAEKWFPKYPAWTCVNSLAGVVQEWENSDSEDVVNLVEGWYISNISKDPGSKWVDVNDTEHNVSFTICDDAYYGYISNWDHFILVTYIDDPANWNYCPSDDENKENWTINALQSAQWNNWNVEFSNIRKRLADADWCNSDEAYPLYLYAY